MKQRLQSLKKSGIKKSVAAGIGRLSSQAREAASEKRDEIRTDLAERRAGMLSTADTTRLGTRRRAVVPLIGGCAALAGLFSMVSANVLAVNFTSSNSTYKIYTDRVVGQHAAGFVNAQQRQAGPAAVAQIGFKQADLNGMCVIAVQNIAGLGNVSLVMTGGEPVNGTVTDPSKKISANELYIASNNLRGTGENISRMTLGQSADTLTMDTITSHRGAAGAFGLQAQVMQVANLDSDSYGIDLQGSINIPDLAIRVVPGSAAKAACLG